VEDVEDVVILAVATDVEGSAMEAHLVVVLAEEEEMQEEEEQEVEAVEEEAFPPKL
jgi:hypothetical protein